MATGGPTNDPFSRADNVENQQFGSSTRMSVQIDGVRSRSQSPPRLTQSVHTGDRQEWRDRRQRGQSYDGKERVALASSRRDPAAAARPWDALLQAARQMREKSPDDAASDAGQSDSTTGTIDNGNEAQFRRVMKSMQTMAVNDSGFTPKPFKGALADTDNVEKWLDYFKTYVQFRGIQGPAKLQLFTLLLQDQAADWLRTIADDVTADFKALLAAFRQRFAPSELNRWKKATTLWTREQQPSESVDTYCTDIINLARAVKIKDNEQIKFAMIKGLRSDVKLHVLQSGAATVDDVVKAARVAEAAISASSTGTQVADLTAQLNELLRHLKSKTDVGTVDTPPSSRSSTPTRRVRFDDGQRRAEETVRQPRAEADRRAERRETDIYSSSDRLNRSPGEQRWRPDMRRQQQQPRQQNNYNARDQYQGQNYSWQSSAGQNQQQQCPQCARYFDGYHSCPAATRYCFRCGAIGHFRASCGYQFNSQNFRGQQCQNYNTRPSNFNSSH